MAQIKFFKEKKLKETVIGKIPKEWELKSIGPHIDLLVGHGFKSEKFLDTDSGLRLVRGINVTTGKIRWYKNITKYWPKLTPELKKYQLQKNDLLIAMDGAKVGKNYALVTEKDLPSLLVQRVARIRSRDLDQSYLYQIIASPIFLNYVKRVNTSSGIAHISGNQIEDFKIPFPSIREQKVIADIFITIDNAIGITNSIIQRIEKLKEELLHKLLTKGIGHKEYRETVIGKIPQEWKVVQLEDVCEINPESLSPSTKIPDKEIFYIDIESVKEGTIASPQKILGKDAPSRARRVVRENDIIMSTVRPYLKAFTPINKKYDGQICSTGFAVLRPKSTINYLYLYYSLLSDKTIQQCNMMMSGGQYPAITSTNVSKIKIPFMSYKEQVVIANILSTLDKKLKTERKEKIQLELTKKALTSLLFTGKIRVMLK